MSTRIVAILLLLSAQVATAQVSSYVVSRRGAKCLAASSSTLIATACDASEAQRFSPNFADGGLQLGVDCLRRTSATVVTLFPCRAGDPAEVFQMNDATMEISSSDGTPGCLTLAGNEWRDRMRVSLEPCAGLAGQKWLLATEAETPARGRKRAANATGEVRSGDYIVVGERCLIVK